MNENKMIYEEEIDLREIFKTIWERKFFIVSFTLIVTLLSIIYVSLKTPIYEVKSVVRIGYIENKLVEPVNILTKKLRLIFNVEGNKENITDTKAVVSNIKAVKGVNNFLEITTRGFSNEIAIQKNKEVIEFLKKEYKYKIDEFIFETNRSIEKLKEDINYIETVEKANVQSEIEKVKNQDIPNIDKKINFLKNIELVTIENKLSFNQKKLKEYEKNLLDINKLKSTNDTQNMLMAMQTLNTQNLILNIQNNIENLIKEKSNLKDIVIKNLEQEKDNLLNDTIRKLNIKLNISLKSKISIINNEIEIEKIKKNTVKNSEIVGKFIKNYTPIKPKKVLSILVAFITGFIISVFLVFFIKFISNLNIKGKE